MKKTKGKQQVECEEWKRNRDGKKRIKKQKVERNEEKYWKGCTSKELKYWSWEGRGSEDSQFLKEVIQGGTDRRKYTE